MADHDRGSSMDADEKLRLWEVIHSLIDKALLDTPHADVHSSKDGLKLLNAVFLKVISLGGMVRRKYGITNQTKPALLIFRQTGDLFPPFLRLRAPSRRCLEYDGTILET